MRVNLNLLKPGQSPECGAPKVTNVSAESRERRAVCRVASIAPTVTPGRVVEQKVCTSRPLARFGAG